MLEELAETGGPEGGEQADFLFAPNPGEPLRPLRLIASSGEISRVMLALKTVLADLDGVPLLVFDEVDANVGGEIGRVVGEKMAAIADSHQVLCVTHLPQVAAQGDDQWTVAKKGGRGKVGSSVTRLDREGRIEELARMLGGEDITPTTRKHAAELLGK